MVQHSLCACLAALVIAGTTHAQFPATDDQKLTPPSGFNNGVSVEIGAEWAFIGAPGGFAVDDERFVHVYRNVAGAWTYHESLTPDTPGAKFGNSLDFDGTTLVVGSSILPKGDQGRATIYAFDGSSWIGFDLARPPSLEPRFGFGGSVAVENELLLVGAPLSDQPTTGLAIENAGAAFAYRRNALGEWVLKQELRSLSPIVNGGFGGYVEIDGGRSIISAGDGNLESRVWIQGLLWTDARVIEPIAPVTQFGFSLDMSDGRAIVGAYEDSTTPGAQQRHVVFLELDCGEWTEVQRLTEPAGALSFGLASAIEGNVAIVGARNESIGGLTSAGRAYAYRWDGATWQFEQQMQATAPQTNAVFGTAVAIHDDTALISARGQSVGQLGRGFIFNATPVPPVWVDAGNALAGTSNTPELHGLGTLDDNSPIELRVSCALPFTQASLVVGLSDLSAPFKGGVLVPDPLLIFGGLPTDIDGNASLASTWPAGIPGGTEIYLQTWIADAGAVQGFSATNAVIAQSAW